MLRLTPPPSETVAVHVPPELVGGETGVVVHVRHLSASERREIEDAARAAATKSSIVREERRRGDETTTRLLPHEETDPWREWTELSAAVLERAVVRWEGVDVAPSRDAMLGLLGQYPAAAQTIIEAIRWGNERPFVPLGISLAGLRSILRISQAAAAATRSAAPPVSPQFETASPAPDAGGGAIDSPIATSPAESPSPPSG